jgi:peptide methionine sulfoxide reductase msrA/msrB
MTSHTPFLVMILAAIPTACLAESRPSPAMPKTETASNSKETCAMTTPPNRKPLTPEESRVLIHKGTERPFAGRFVDHHEEGTYLCRQCGAPLFPSSAKFDSRSGWPSFDEALPGAVREIPDADGTRTEIVCAQCGGHLGHVFRGEGFTPKQTRHCVNSLSMDFDPGTPLNTEPASPGKAEAYFAGGCFWGVEHLLQEVPGVISVESGYMGGKVDRPTYRQVLTGETGHAEAVKVVYDPTRVTYGALAKRFFEIHDPTQVNRQGPDIGHQYRSVVFVSNDDERRKIRELIDRLRGKGLGVATTVEQAGTFWPAEDYHQDYYVKTGKEPYCHAPVDRFGDGMKPPVTEP